MLAPRGMFFHDLYQWLRVLSLASARRPVYPSYTACDVNAEWTESPRRFWAEANLAERIELRLGPALHTLDALLGEGQAGSFDMAIRGDTRGRRRRTS